MRNSLLVIALLFAFNVSAYEGGLQSTFSPQLDAMELENSVKYDYLKSKYDTESDYITKLEICRANGKYYMPNNGSADGDGCYDVVGVLSSLKLSGSEVSYANSDVVVTNANLHAQGASSNGGIGEGKFLADYLCYQASAGARAMRTGDIKYLNKAGTIPAQNNILSFGGVEGFNSTTSTVYAYDLNGVVLNSSATSPNCDSYTLAGATSRPVLNASSGPLMGNHSNCSTAGRIVCVND